MKILHLSCIGLIVLAVLLTGCTSQPAQTPATPVPTAPPTTAATTVPAAAPSLSGTTWKLAWFDDTKGVWSKVAEGSEVTATFLGDGKVTGSGGCNGYSAEYQLGNVSRVWVRRPEVPNRECQTPFGVMKQESYFFTDLMNAETYSFTPEGKLLIYDKTNKKILQFDPS